MNDQQHAFWLAYIRHLADLLGLKDWQFELDRERPDNLSVGAQFSSLYGQKRARLWLNTTTMLSRPPEELREVLVHELMHAHFEDLDEHVRLYVESVGGSAHFDSVYNREREITLETMVLVVAPFLPLPANEEAFAKHGISHINVTFNGDADRAQAVAAWQAAHGPIDIGQELAASIAAYSQNGAPR